MDWENRSWEVHPVLLGPWPLSMHLVFAVVEAAVVVYLLWFWRKHGKVTQNELFWLYAAFGAHAVFTLFWKKPTFDLEIRYYGVFFAVGLLLAARAFPLYFERWGFPRKHGEALTLWTPLLMILGAHLVHMVFYEWDSIIHNPQRLLQIGSGLASHGGGIGAVLAVFLYARAHKVDPLKYMDPAMCASTFVIPWVRVGNFFNSEIVGILYEGPTALRFPYGDEDCPSAPENPCWDAPLRHPSQLYEAALAFIMVGLAIYLQRKWRNRLRPGAIFFILNLYYFTTRFFIEYVKEYETEWGTPFRMGQLLSLPIILGCAYMIFVSKRSNILKPYHPEVPAPAGAVAADPDELASGVTEKPTGKVAKKKRKKKS